MVRSAEIVLAASLEAVLQSGITLYRGAERGHLTDPAQSVEQTGGSIARAKEKPMQEEFRALQVRVRAGAPKAPPAKSAKVGVSEAPPAVAAKAKGPPSGERGPGYVSLDKETVDIEVAEDDDAASESTRAKALEDLAVGHGWDGRQCGARNVKAEMGRSAADRRRAPTWKSVVFKVVQTVDKIHTARNAEEYDNSDSAFFSIYLALLGAMQNQGSGKLVYLLDKALETENEKLRLQLSRLSRAGFDHHCRYLNVCVGGRTYPAWYSFVVLLLALMSICAFATVHAMNEPERHSLNQEQPVLFFLFVGAAAFASHLTGLFLFALLARG
ncbi:unnamed protein product [Effrenium voratum]|nr:unnamed protein product [Effrenium voratum]